MKSFKKNDFLKGPMFGMEKEETPKPVQKDNKVDLLLEHLKGIDPAMIQRTIAGNLKASFSNQPPPDPFTDQPPPDPFTDQPPPDPFTDQPPPDPFTDQPPLEY